jgi:hypothetical protein
MSDKLSLSVEDLQVSTFTVQEGSTSAMALPAGDSWPAICTCIGICDGTADIYCSGGCPPFAVAAAPVAAEK